MLEAGIKGRQEVMVTDENSAAVVGSGVCNSGDGCTDGENRVDERGSVLKRR